MSEGVNSAEDVLGGGAYGIGILDDIAEGVAQRLVAKIEEAESVGVAIDGGFGLDAETVHDDFGAAPLQEGLVDFVAASVFADLATEAVMGEVYLVAFARVGGVVGEFGLLTAG
ncbi:MAG: hypothetical protein WCA34_17365 [Candidatus Acidiferrales bacterium]